MTTRPFIEDTVELAALHWLHEVGYTPLHGPTIAPGEPDAERASYRDVILTNRLEQALARLNPTLPPAALAEAQRLLLRVESPSLHVNNHRFHRLLVEGVSVPYQKDGRTAYTSVRLLDFDHPANNDWLAVNQFSIVKEGVVSSPSLARSERAPLQDTRRPDIILFVNGLPLVVIELKNAADEAATALTAYHQLQTYQNEIPSLFIPNAALVAADGTDARLGSLTAGWEWFKAWRTIDGKTLEDNRAQLETLIKGALAPRYFLDLLRYFTIFETHRDRIAKKIAGYHQFHAAQTAAAATRAAVHPDEDGRVGVIWHTQGSGKSLTMLFYAGKIIQDPALQNPTLVILTDRNDLDQQLFDQFALGHELLRQQPVQAESRDDLRARLQVASGGVIFTTIQKFQPDDGADEHPLLSQRHNIVFIVDEAHRTQYGFDVHFTRTAAGIQRRYGLAKYMRDALPNAAFIGFTGTPIALGDRNTAHVFGDYLDVYDIQQSVQDQATVPIYYEPRHARLRLDERYAQHIDPDFEEITEGQEEATKELLKTKWGRLARIVGEPDRLQLVAQDIVNHYETRDTALPGKAMIVCMTRDICVRLYDQLVALRPYWHHPDDDKGQLKVIMTGSTSETDWQQHIRTNARRKALADRFRDDASDFKLVIVRDMWLTGFDAPSLHTMYLDKPMKGHTLMQAIARVNRVYPRKEGGLVVAYLPLQLQLQEALKAYTEADQALAGRLQEEAAAVMREKADVVRAHFHGFNYQPFFLGDPAARLTIMARALNHILAGRDPKRDRYLHAVAALARAYALALPHPHALAIRDEVGFFQAVAAALKKTITTPPSKNGHSLEDVERQVQSIIDRAVAPDEVVDIFTVAGLPRPDISLLSDEFLLEVAALPQKNVAAELLRRLIEDEIRAQQRRNLTVARSFALMLREAIGRYNHMELEAREIIDQLIQLAREMREAQHRGEQLGLTDDELAFYDALEVNDSAVAVLGDDTLKEIAQELVRQVRANISIDWTLKDSARAHMRVIVKRILRRYGYPPDKQQSATETVISQAELLSTLWSGD